MLPGVDFNETFAPVDRISSIRIILAIATKRNLELTQLDIKTAFLSADMDTEVYVTLPPGFSNDPSLNLPNKNSRTVHRLLKGVPGIPQGSYLFNKKIHKVFISLGFVRLADDYCVYKHTSQDVWVCLVLWVDDILLAYDSKENALVKKLISTLQGIFKVHLLGPVSDLLGVTVRRNRQSRTMSVDQSHAVLKLLEKAGMSNCNPYRTPVQTSFKFTKQDCPDEVGRLDFAEEARWYRSVLASTIYLSIWTRPDISFAISRLGKFMHNPGEKHLAALKKLLRYLKGTAKRCLKFDFASAPPRKGVYGYFDASHADDPDTRRSTMAYIVFFDGCPISWYSKTHKYMTLSSNQSEYVTSAKAAKEAKWLSKVFGQLSKQTICPIALFGDNKGANAMTQNPVNHAGSKHVEIADHYAREQVSRGLITVNFVKSQDNIADVFTKALPFQSFRTLTEYFMSDEPVVLSQ